MPIGAARIGLLGGVAPPGSQTFSTPGTYTFKVPRGVTRLVADIASAQGGDGKNTSSGTHSPGGNGGRIQAHVPVTPGEDLTVIVGSKPSLSNQGPGGTGDGTGGSSVSSGFGNGGGGSSALKRGGTRLLAPGAGAGGSWLVGSNYPGGVGGGVGNGGPGNGPSPGGGATTSAPGAASSAGGISNPGSGSDGGSGESGGGAGYFGGAGGSNNSGTGSGGGGSGHADPSCTTVTGTDGYQTGDGSATLSWA